MNKKSKSPVVLAIAAHPDDIEFMAAGTLLLLKQAGCETHYLNVANGSCGRVSPWKQGIAGLTAGGRDVR